MTLPVVAITDPVTTLIIEDIHPSLNAWTHWHWTRVHAESRRWQWLVREAAGRAKPYVRPVIVTVSYFFPTHRKHDYDNYTPKFILDGIKGLLIPDDSSDVIEELRIRFGHDREHPRTEITLHPT